MPAGDVWILGAGASAEARAPTIEEFRKAAREVAASSHGQERQTLDSVLNFWQKRLPSFNIEELFGFVDSKVLASVTQEGDLSEMRQKTVFLIAKVITAKVEGPRSQMHIDFIKNHVEDFVPIITLNWDILLDNAILANERRVTYAFRDHGDWDPDGKGTRSQVLLKLHGSLNWLLCRACGRVSYLPRKEDAVSFLVGRALGITCSSCETNDELDVLLIPPVLSKLERGDSLIEQVWRDAYMRLQDAKRVVIIGYSFPPTDIQTKLFISKALKAADNLKKIEVVTRPKFGSARSQFEDRYVDALKGSDKTDCLDFVYKTFGQYVEWLGTGSSC